MCSLREIISRVAISEATILLTGPSGSGKENAARAVHAASPRAAGPFEAVNCGAIPADLAEAELFGAEAGAYTGALKARIGRLEAANGGTLFLDEIGDLPLPLQVKLLRALETRSIERLGSRNSIAVDFRIIAATNVDLDLAVAQGRFRDDLYWRLAVVLMALPSLAERTEDIPALVQHFANREQQRIHLPDCGAAILMRHDWPGNLRELRNLVDRALAMGEPVLDAAAVGRILQPRRRPMAEWLAEPQAAPSANRAFTNTLPPSLSPLAMKSLLAEAEAAMIAHAIATGESIAQSARLLGMKRTTLIEKMKRMGLKAAANEAA